MTPASPNPASPNPRLPQSRREIRLRTEMTADKGFCRQGRSARQENQKFGGVVDRRNPIFFSRLGVVGVLGGKKLLGKAQGRGGLIAAVGWVTERTCRSPTWAATRVAPKKAEDREFFAAPGRVRFEAGDPRLVDARLPLYGSQRGAGVRGAVGFHVGLSEWVCSDYADLSPDSPSERRRPR